MKENDKKKCEEILKATAWFNNGNGLLIPSWLDKRIKLNKIKGNYTVEKNLST